MDAMLEPVRQLLEGEIDFHGQYHVELVSNVFLIATGVLAFLAGFVTQDITNTLYVGLGGTALTLVLTVPSWPFYNKHPLQFLPAKTGPMAGLEGINVRLDEKR